MNIWTRRIFIILAIGGGFTGAALTSAQLFQSGKPVIYYLLCFGFVLAFSSGIWGGIVLAEDEQRGIEILSWFFLAQIPYIISPVASYQFASGFMAYASLGNHGFSWMLYYGGRWQFSFLQLGESTFAIGLNFFALWATWYLRRLRAPNEANQAPEPTATAVTPPAAQEPRQP